MRNIVARKRDRQKFREKFSFSSRASTKSDLQNNHGSVSSALVIPMQGKAPARD
jgi:hypothetical protein